MLPDNTPAHCTVATYRPHELPKPTDIQRQPTCKKKTFWREGDLGLLASGGSKAPLPHHRSAETHLPRDAACQLRAAVCQRVSLPAARLPTPCEAPAAPQKNLWYGHSNTRLGSTAWLKACCRVACWSTGILVGYLEYLLLHPIVFDALS